VFPGIGWSQGLEINWRQGLKFDGTGRLMAAPERIVGDSLVFSVVASDTLDPLRKVIDYYVAGIEGINEEITDYDNKGSGWFGLEEASLKNVKEAMCSEVGAVSKPIERLKEFYEAKLQALNCSDGENNGLVPKLKRLSGIEYSVETTCPGKTKVDTLKLNRANSFRAAGGAAGCRRVNYELRQSNPFSAELRNWDDPKRVKPPTESIHNVRRALGKPNGPRTVLGKWKQLVKTIGLGETPRPDIVTTAIQEVEEAIKAVDGFQDSLGGKATEWVIHWLWLSKGHPRIDPLPRVNKSKLAEKKKELSELEASVKTVELIAKEGDFVLMTEKLDSILRELGKTRARRDHVAKEVKQLNEKAAQARELLQRDRLLYKGMLFVGEERPEPVLRHHDAQDQYVDLAVKRVDEISESERLFVLVANENPRTVLKLEVEVTEIANDLTRVEEDLREAQVEQDVPDDEPKKRFLASYKKLEQKVQRLSEQLVLPDFSVSSTADKTPKFVTTLVAHNVATAPAKVEYTIRAKREGKEVDVGRDEYRINKLYRVRFKTGLLFSYLEREEGKKKKNHGFDGTFGVQIYFDPGGRDIRRAKSWPVAYVGSSMRDPAENLFLGLGVEPYSGLTLLVGGHGGRTDRTTEEGDEITVEEEWDWDTFMSVALDVGLLKRLFGLSSVLNPAD
jgi:hypothetical protein